MFLGVRSEQYLPALLRSAALPVVNPIVGLQRPVTWQRTTDGELVSAA